MTKHFIIGPRTNLRVCLEQKLYGHRRNVLKDWVIGDRVIYYADGKLAALGTVTGKPYFDDQTKVWPDDIYPYRIKVTPDVVLDPPNWVPVEEEIKKTLRRHLGQHWILYIRDVHPIPPALFGDLHSLIVSRAGITQEQPSEDFQALKKEAQKQVEKRERQPTLLPQKVIEEEAEDLIGTSKEAQSHDRTQWYLIKLGRALGCDVWVARNDQGKSYKGEAFADLCIKRMPNLGFDSDTSRIIENIDVIWLQSNVIQCAFEVEHTTSIYSGLLRLADLVASQPHIKIKLFIVAPTERRPHVVYQLNRPVFRNLLLDVCKYIPYDKLESTLAKIEDFQGYLQVGLVEKIAEDCSLDKR